MSGGQTRRSQVCADCAHRVALTIAGDAADPIKVAIDEQHRLQQAATLRCLASVGDAGIIVQVPRARWAEAVRLERLYQHGEVRWQAREPDQVELAERAT